MAEADVLRMAISLAFIVLFILGGAWLMRRAGWLRSGNNRAIKVVGVHSLGARSSVAVLQVDDVRLVVGVTPQQITLLHTLPGEDESTEASQLTSIAAQPAFARSLRSALAHRRSGSDALQP